MEFFCSRPMRLCAKRACDDDDDDDDDDGDDDDRSQTLMPPADRCFISRLAVPGISVLYFW